MNKRHFQSMVRSLKHDSLSDLKAELKMQNKHVADSEKEIAYLKLEIAEIEKAIYEKQHQTKISAQPLPVGVKSLPSKQRYAMFNEMLQRSGNNHSIYRDRLNGNDVSVKVFLRDPFRAQAHKLADKVSVNEHSGRDCMSYYCTGSGKVHRVERYIFRNVMDAKRPQPCERGRTLRWKVLHSDYSPKATMQRRVASWSKHLDSCNQCQAFRDSLVKNKL